MSTVPSTGSSDTTWDWTIPDTTKSSGTTKSSDGSITNAAGGAMGKDQFVKLLVAQMSNQDPLNPMDGQQMAAQLAQFSSVEQLININSKLDALATAIKAASTNTNTNTGS
jgi:flagellar basal-body rod modification protein FlgD